MHLTEIYSLKQLKGNRRNVLVISCVVYVTDFLEFRLHISDRNSFYEAMRDRTRYFSFLDIE